MPASQPILLVLITIIIIILQSQIQTSNSQQQYISNLQLNCTNNDNRTLGFVCNGTRSTCTAYLTFRSSPPRYTTSENIASLLSANASDIARLNNISVSEPLPAGQMIVVPVACSCTSVGNNRYYQHNATYRLREEGETYLAMASNTYQGLTTCQAMMSQNRFEAQNLHTGDEFQVPLRCACPTAEQERRYGAQFLLYYVVIPGDDVPQIADMFGVDMQSVLDANELNFDSTIFAFSPIVVPLQSVPININFSLHSPVPSPQSIPQPTPSRSGNSSKKGVFVGVGIGVGVLVLVLSLIFAWVCFLRRSKKPAAIVTNEKKGTKKDPESGECETLAGSYGNSSQNPKSWSVTLDGIVCAIKSLTVYKFAELEKATDKFSEANKIKGSVFRGELNGEKVAIKILKGGVASEEINVLKQINHSNIIRLSGYSIHEGNTYLIYEFAEKESLDIWLSHDQSEEDSLPVLGWRQRVQIACNIADALNYLHSYVNPPYIHKNLKSSNIVLDANYKAKITNFGLARTAENRSENGELRVTQHVIGTHGYLAPEYLEHGVMTLKLDVFAFGVLLLELLSGKPAVFPSENKKTADNLLFMVMRKVFEGENVREELMGFMDSNMGNEYPLDLAYSMAQLALKCVDQDMNSRPSMSEVSMILSKIYSSLEC